MIISSPSEVDFGGGHDRLIPTMTMSGLSRSADMGNDPLRTMSPRRTWFLA